ncbi:MAG TPA: hypothetical protein VHZ95_17935 [Polyangiales bacterium]|nr:hypothetical protein [Polyangiales bacterium]
MFTLLLVLIAPLARAQAVPTSKQDKAKTTAPPVAADAGIDHSAPAHASAQSTAATAKVPAPQKSPDSTIKPAATPKPQAASAPLPKEDRAVAAQLEFLRMMDFLKDYEMFVAPPSADAGAPRGR